MLDYITLPMPEECSSALRYDLAKFDSAEIREEYSRIYELYRDGKLSQRITRKPATTTVL